MLDINDLIFDELRVAQKKATHLVVLGTVFVLFCHFYVVEPYFHFKEREKVAEATLPSIEQKLENINSNIIEIKKISTEMSSTLADIEGEIDRFPDLLRDKLTEIQAVLKNRRTFPQSEAMPNIQTNQMQLQQPHPTVSSLMLPRDIVTFEQGVQWYFEDWFQYFSDKIDRTLVIPLKEITGIIEVKGADQLGEKAKTAIKRIRTHIHEIDPNFWRHYSGVGSKTDVAHQLKMQFTSSFRPINEEINHIIKQAEDAKGSLTKEHDGISKEMKAARNNIANLSKRIEIIESPFGRLPLDLTDLILMFPFLIAAILVVFSMTVNKYTGFYLCQKVGKTQADKAIVNMLSGSWCLPPYKNAMGRILLTLWFGLYTVIYIREGTLILMRSDMLAAFANATISIKPYLFKIFFCLGFGVICGAAVSVIRSDHRIKKGVEMGDAAL